MQEKSSLVEESWNVKRIIIALLATIFLIAGAYGLKNYISGKNNLFQGNEKKQTESVKGEATQKTPAIKIENLKPLLEMPQSNEIKVEAQKKLEEIKQEVGSLKLDEVASSSPQIQRILNDIKSLEQYPKNQVKDTCLSICNSIN